MNIILKGKDGSVAIMSLVDGADVEETVQKFKDSHPEGFYVDYFEYDGYFPLSREFRDAWTIKGTKVEIDNTKAMKIHLGRVRVARNRELEKLDKEQLRYLSDPWKPKEIEEKKQILRDLPATVVDLNWPDNLTRGE